jgi:hypothetical protein
MCYARGNITVAIHVTTINGAAFGLYRCCVGDGIHMRIQTCIRTYVHRYIHAYIRTFHVQPVDLRRILTTSSIE